MLWIFACLAGPMEGVTQPIGRSLPPVTEQGNLSGWVIVVSPGHGKLLHYYRDRRTQFGWMVQRKEQHGLTEDDWTMDFVDRYLAPALEVRGATVLSMRERDPSGRAELFQPVAMGPVELGRVGQSAFLLPAAGEATWSLRGEGRVYVRWVAAPGRDPSAHYLLGDRRVDVDQRYGGGLWWPLGEIDGATTLTLIGSGVGTLSAGDVRVGGGSFEADFPKVRARETLPFREVAAAHSLEVLGGPESLLGTNGKTLSDPRFRAVWASWALKDRPKTLFVSIHTNAGRGRGTTVFVGVDHDTRPVTPARPRSRRLAEHVASSFRARVEPLVPQWTFRGVWDGDLSEISPAWNELDGVLLELGFHDRKKDVERLLDPEFLAAAAEGTAIGVERFVLEEGR